MEMEMCDNDGKRHSERENSFCGVAVAVAVTVAAVKQICRVSTIPDDATERGVLARSIDYCKTRITLRWDSV